MDGLVHRGEEKPGSVITCLECLSYDEGTLFVSLHAEIPQQSAAENEVAYASYARVAVFRGTQGWTTADGPPAKDPKSTVIRFPECTGGSATIESFGISMRPHGAAPLLVAGETRPQMPVGNGVTCQLTLDFDSLFGFNWPGADK